MGLIKHYYCCSSPEDLKEGNAQVTCACYQNIHQCPVSDLP